MMDVVADNNEGGGFRRIIHPTTACGTPNPKQQYGDRKPPLALIPGSAMILISMALKQGAEKYGPFNWRDNPVETLTYASAMARHLFSWIDGEDIDPESGYPHLAHLGAGNMILLDAIANGRAIDTRPAKGMSGDLIRQYAHAA